MATTAELSEAHELRMRALMLSPEIRERLALELLDSVEVPDQSVDDVKNANREEIARRIEAVRNGKMEMYTLEETMDYLQKVVDEVEPS